jgi:hypothetical protein
MAKGPAWMQGEGTRVIPNFQRRLADPRPPIRSAAPAATTAQIAPGSRSVRPIIQRPQAVPVAPPPAAIEDAVPADVAPAVEPPADVAPLEDVSAVVEPQPDVMQPTTVTPQIAEAAAVAQDIAAADDPRTQVIELPPLVVTASATPAVSEPERRDATVKPVTIPKGSAQATVSLLSQVANTSTPFLGPLLLDPRAIVGLMEQESGLNPAAIGKVPPRQGSSISRHSYGLFQLLDDTAANLWKGRNSLPALVKVAMQPFPASRTSGIPDDAPDPAVKAVLGTVHQAAYNVAFLLRFARWAAMHLEPDLRPKDEEGRRAALALAKLSQLYPDINPYGLLFSAYVYRSSWDGATAVLEDEDGRRMVRYANAYRRV